MFICFICICVLLMKIMEKKTQHHDIMITCHVMKTQTLWPIVKSDHLICEILDYERIRAMSPRISYSFK